ncbi:MAG: hypothetical protein Q9228_004137 [Teloschistes exilis]
MIVPLPRIHLLLDFDSTLTHASTLPLIYNIGFTHQHSSHHISRAYASSSHPLFCSPSPPTYSWSHISALYTHSYVHHTHAYLPPAPLRKTLEQETAWLESLRDVERESYERVEGSGVFKSVRAKDMLQGAEAAVKCGQLRMRDGWTRVMGMARRRGGEGRGGKVGVVSVGWSGEFIRGCLRAALVELLEASESGERRQEVESEVDIEDIVIRANEILGGEEGKMSRYFEENERGGKGGIWTARDKRRVMEMLLRREQGRADRDGSMAVYVGDSPTDLECLLAADVGICMREEGEMSGEQRALEETLQRIGTECQWIGDMKPTDLGARSTDLGNIKQLWWTTNFDQICDSYLFQAAINSESNDTCNSDTRTTG